MDSDSGKEGEYVHDPPGEVDGRGQVFAGGRRTRSQKTIYGDSGRITARRTRQGDVIVRGEGRNTKIDQLFLKSRVVAGGGLCRWHVTFVTSLLLTRRRRHTSLVDLALHATFGQPASTYVREGTENAVRLVMDLSLPAR
jgi:hypothetical protein